MINLTSEEEQLILEHRKNKEKNSVKKIGVLKHDLFTYIENKSPMIDYDYENLTDREVKERCLKFETCFELCAPKGTKFICYTDDGEECWYDDENLGFVELSSDWARKHLENIRLYKKSSKK